MNQTSAIMNQTSKPHYEILDGLRGVAAVLVMLYHIGEGFATSPVDQSVNHGYLAVDFFFILSGFVTGYAYDDRWDRGLTVKDFLSGFLRLMFSFSAGLLMSRIFRPGKVRGAFWICSAVLCALLSAPHIGGGERLWLNGLYEAVCVIFIFPVLVWLGASGKATDRATSAMCGFLGDTSYPVYVVHYPLMYLFYAWLWGGPERIPFGRAWPAAAAVLILSVLLAWVCLKFYDEPLRRRLSGRIRRHA